MTEEIKTETLENTGFTEAPASINFYGVTGKGWNIQVTLRDANEFRLMERFAALTAWLDEKHVTPKPVGQQPAPLPDPQYRNGSQPQETPAQNIEASEYDGWVQFTRLIISPQPDERVNLEFFEAGHRYPDLKVNKWKLPQAQGLLKHITDADVSRPHDLQVEGLAYYKSGKEYQPGKHYKDVTHVRPLDWTEVNS